MNRLCLEAQECLIDGRWMDLASLMLTSCDLIFSKASDKGKLLLHFFPFLGFRESYFSFSPRVLYNS